MIAERIARRALADGSGSISFQVVRETLNVLTCKLGASPHDARRCLDAVLAPLWTVTPSPSPYADALDARSRFGFVFHDSPIIAAAIVAGCIRLLREDLQAGQSLHGMTVVDPFS